MIAVRFANEFGIRELCALRDLSYAIDTQRTRYLLNFDTSSLLIREPIGRSILHKVYRIHDTLVPQPSNMMTTFLQGSKASDVIFELSHDRLLHLRSETCDRACLNDIVNEYVNELARHIVEYAL